MGFPPPKDAPPPEEQSQAGIDAGFEPSPTGAQLCGFQLPGFQFSIQLPGFQLPSIALPNLNLALSLNCDLSDPIDGEFGFGGGRVGTADVDQDDEFKRA